MNTSAQQSESSTVSATVLQVSAVVVFVALVGPMTLQVYAWVSNLVQGTSQYWLYSSPSIYLLSTWYYALPLLPALIFFRRPLIATLLYVMTFFLHAEWASYRMRPDISALPPDYSFWTRFPKFAASAILAGCTLALAFWLLGKYNSRFRVRVI